MPLMPYRILHVDDDAVFRDFVQAVFAHDKEYQVVSRASAEDGLACVETTPPDIVIADIMMPEKGGLEFIHELRRIPATEKTPVLILSARSSDLQKYALLEERAAMILTKPIEPDTLRSRVKSFLNK